MPAHNHTIAANSADANDQAPGNTFPAGGGAYHSAANTTMNPAMAGIAGGNQPHSNLRPLLVLNWIIALEGIFPSRN